MAQIKMPTAEIPHETIHMQIDDPGMSFNDIHAAVKERAREINPQAMMLAWFDENTGVGHPNYECSSERPFWEMFAESRGGNLRIEVNKGEYVFIYLKL